MSGRLFSILAVALIPSIVTAETSTPGGSGIQGVILVSPSRPGPIRKDQPSAAPAGNVEFVVKRGDARVTSFTTDAAGGFRVALPPGRYTILREDPGAKIGHWQFEAEVAPGQVLKVNWTGDSGMR
ncbi:MAG: carboxypeptidase-like regulatory domain-containing protein [Chthoniobacterales bacterium]